MADDFYKTLGVRRDASQAEIQKAYRELARKYHPDLHPDDKNAKKKFQEVQAAFDVLNNAEKREMYDRYGSSFEARGARGGPGPGPQGGFGGVNMDDATFAQFFGDRFEGGAPGDFGDLGEIFRQFRHQQAGPKTRRGAGGGAARRGGDLTSEVQIPFATSIVGGEVQLSLERAEDKHETVAVKIPPGIEDGKKIRLRGQGDAGPRGGTPGDLIIVVRVSPHQFFQRHGDQLTLRLPVTLAEAAAGAKVDVPTPAGIVALRIPPGTSSGTKLRIRGHGVPAKNRSAGDLVAEVQIILPKHISDADRQALAEIDQRYPHEPRAHLHW